MGNSHGLRFLPVNVSRQEFVSWKNYEGSCSCSFVMPGHDHCCAFGCTNRRNNFCGQLIAEDSTSAKWAHPFHRHSRWLYMLLSSSFRVQHCFFFVFFFNFSGHSLCSEHCSQLEHCVACSFSVHYYTKVQQFFSIYLFIYFQIKMCLRDSTSEK